MQITCFTDLKDSTSLTEHLGHDEYLPQLHEHLRIGRILADLSGGRYIKNEGDAHMVTFTTVESALQFATEIQQCCTENPSLLRTPSAVRVTLFLGIVEPTPDDVYGSGVNQAARVVHIAQEGEVIVNEAFSEACKHKWGGTEQGRLLTSKGQYELKGITDPPRQELYSFDWKRYRQEHPEHSLAGLVYDDFQKASVEVSNLSMGDIGTPSLVIWPVVPRDLATAIHRGQAEIIRLLALLGWTVRLLVVDCGTSDFDRPYCEKFSRCIRDYLSVRGVGLTNIAFMSDLYDPRSPGYDVLQSIFRRIASDLSLEDLLAINNKDYSSNIKDEIRRSATLDFLRPALSTAAVLFMAGMERKKCIVVSGADERIQWERTYRFPGTRDQLGVLMNPILRMDEGHESRQKSDWPIWDSQQSLVRDMEATNLAWWVFRMHVFLPSFPASSIEMSGLSISPESWEDGGEPPAGLRSDELARRVWRVLAPRI
jgi:hypothetical protein